MQLSQIMDLRGITDADLARSLKCQRSTILHWRRGSHFPRADMLLKICEELDCSADEILGLEKIPGITRARFNELYRALTQRGQYDSDMLHQMATKFAKSKGGKLSFMERWFRDIAEALYKCELVAKYSAKTIQAIQEECEQMMMF